MSDLKLTVTSWGQVMLDKRELRAVMRGAGNDIRNKTARLINSTDGGGRLYRHKSKPGTYHASTPGNPPVRSGGALRASLKTYVFKSAEGFAVRARQFYALFLETGARGGGNPYGSRGKSAAPKGRRGGYRRAKGRYTNRVLEPRPFLDKVMTQEAPELDRRVRRALSEALTWKATK